MFGHQVPFTKEEVYHAVHQLKHNKALGNAWISPEVLQHHRDTKFYEALTIVMNTARTKGVPPEWNTLQVTSLHKKGDPSDPGNYRGISVMACLPKLFATLQLARLDRAAEHGEWRAPT